MNLRDVRATWETLGHEDPLWAVLSWEGKEYGRWDVKDFFDKGEEDIRRLFEQAGAIGILPSTGEALDFGCGVGRLSAALAKRFQAVVGVDVSQSMVAEARRLVGEKAGCEFIVSTTRALPFDAGRFDVVVSSLVLQHMSPRLSEGYIREFIRVLRPGGLAIFQVPSHSRRGSSSRHRFLRWLMNRLPSQWREEIHRHRGRKDLRRLPMYGIPRWRILRVVENAGGRLVGCIEDEAAGPNWRSFHYFVQVDGQSYLHKPQRMSGRRSRAAGGARPGRRPTQSCCGEGALHDRRRATRVVYSDDGGNGVEVYENVCAPCVPLRIGHTAGATEMHHADAGDLKERAICHSEAAVQF